MEEVTFVVIYSVRRYTCLPGNNRLRLVFYHQAATRSKASFCLWWQYQRQGELGREDKTRRRCVQIWIFPPQPIHQLRSRGRLQPFNPSDDQCCLWCWEQDPSRDISSPLITIFITPLTHHWHRTFYIVHNMSLSKILLSLALCLEECVNKN